MDEFRVNKRSKKQGLAGNLGGQSQGLSKRYLEGVYDLARQYEVSEA